PSAAWTTSRAAASSMCQPKLLHPSPVVETEREPMCRVSKQARGEGREKRGVVRRSTQPGSTSLWNALPPTVWTHWLRSSDADFRSSGGDDERVRNGQTKKVATLDLCRPVLDSYRSANEARRPSAPKRSSGSPAEARSSSASSGRMSLVIRV